MAHKTLIDGTSYQVKGGRTLIDGTGYKIKKGRTLIGGTGYDITFGTPIGELAVGTSVYMNVDGVSKEFIIVHQGNPDTSMYDNSCNGTWLLMKDIYENLKWNSSQSGDYRLSDIDDYLNYDFLNKFDSDIKNIIKNIRIPYREEGSIDDTNIEEDTVRSKSLGMPTNIFLLSGREVGFTKTSYGENGLSGYLSSEGTKLDYFESRVTSSARKLRIANYNGSAGQWWLRSTSTVQDIPFYVTKTGYGGKKGSTFTSGVRPALILPLDQPVDDNFNVTV